LSKDVQAFGLSLLKLTVRDAAELLGVSQKRVYSWIEEGRLPAYKMNEQFRFNKAELLEWATDEGLPVSPRLFEEAKSEGGALSSVAEALARGGVILPLPEEVDREILLSVLMAREALGSTAVGDGIAIPHVRNPIVLHVDEPIVSLAYLAQPVDFGALDGKPVRALFTLVTPTVRTHLHLLSRIAFLLKQPAFRDAVTREADADEILKIARDVEASTTAPKKPA
jgi:PTS system nitrogen regulatory IIA component